MTIPPTIFRPSLSPAGAGKRFHGFPWAFCRFGKEGSSLFSVCRAVRKRFSSPAACPAGYLTAKSGWPVVACDTPAVPLPLCLPGPRRPIGGCGRPGGRGAGAAVLQREGRLCRPSLRKTRRRRPLAAGVTARCARPPPPPPGRSDSREGRRYPFVRRTIP